jgi:hypothetical protein
VHDFPSRSEELYLSINALGDSLDVVSTNGLGLLNIRIRVEQPYLLIVGVEVRSLLLLLLYLKDQLHGLHAFNLRLGVLLSRGSTCPTLFNAGQPRPSLLRTSLRMVFKSGTVNCVCLFPSLLKTLLMFLQLGFHVDHVVVKVIYVASDLQDSLRPCSQPVDYH